MCSVCLVTLVPLKSIKTQYVGFQFLFLRNKLDTFSFFSPERDGMLCLCLAALIISTWVLTLHSPCPCDVMKSPREGSRHSLVNLALIKLPAQKLDTLIKWPMISCLDQHLASGVSRCFLGVTQSE